MYCLKMLHFLQLQKNNLRENKSLYIKTFVKNYSRVFICYDNNASFYCQEVFCQKTTLLVLLYN